MPAQLMNQRPPTTTSHTVSAPWTSSTSTTRTNTSSHNYSTQRAPTFSSTTSPSSRRSLPPEKNRSMSDLPRPNADYSGQLSRSNTSRYEENITTDDMKLHNVFVDDKTFDDLTRSLLTTSNHNNSNNYARNIPESIGKINNFY
jgi:hypothetical protein